MKEENLHGLACPKCGGMINIPEGVLIVRCPFCDLRSYVRGDRGLLRYQVPRRIDRQGAAEALKKFLTSNMAIAPAASKHSRLSEAFLVYLPFWTIWGRVAAWIFGEKQVGSGDDRRYQPREVRVLKDLTWNGAACDVGEFGVTQVPPVETDLLPFDPQALHEQGMVFEPIGSSTQAQQDAEQHFQDHLQRSADLDRLSQVFQRTMRRRTALVYHPLWVLRYLFRGRTFQVVVDGYSGKVLYGKAPGNTLYRAAILVLGMAIGAFLAIDVPAFLLYLTNTEEDIIWLALALLVAGLGMMTAAYRIFRHGEQYEYRSGVKPSLPGFESPWQMITSVKDVEKWIDQLS